MNDAIENAIAALRQVILRAETTSEEIAQLEVMIWRLEQMERRT